MPGPFINAITALIGAVKASATAVKIFKFIATAALLAGAAKLLAPKIEDDKRFAQHKETVTGNHEPRNIIYGETEVGGHLILIGTSGAERRFLHYAITYAGHEIEDILQWYIDDPKNFILASNLDGSGFPTTGYGSQVGESGDAVIRIRFYTGTETQTVDTVLDSAFVSGWTVNHTGRGNAYTAIRFEVDDLFKGFPRDVVARVQGSLLYDPRLDSTKPGGSGTHREADSTTWAYATNPALALRDYLTDDVNGVGEAHSRIDDALVQAAADICDETVAIPTAATQTRYTCNGIISTGNPLTQNLEALLTSMMGVLAYSGGEWKMYAGAFDPATVTLTEDDLRGEMEILTQTGRRQGRYNAVRGNFPDPTRDYEIFQFKPIINSTYETEDGSERIWRDVEFPFTQDRFEAQRNAIILSKASREMITVKFPAKMTAYRLDIWETVQLTIAELSWTDKIFRVIGWEYDPKDGGPNLILKEEASTVYNDPAEGDYDDPDLGNNDAEIIEKPVNPISLIAARRYNGIGLTWDNVVEDDFRYVEITRAAVNSRTDASVAVVGRPRGNEFLHDLNEVGYYWIRKVNRFGEVSSYHPLGAASGVLGRVITERLVIDPGFNLTEELGINWLASSDANYDATGVSIVSGGGVEGNRLIMVQSDNTVAGTRVFNTPVPPIPITTGQHVQGSFRARRVTAISSDGSIQVNMHAGTHEGSFNPTISQVVAGTGKNLQELVNVSSWVINEWQEYQGSTPMQNQAKPMTQFPFLTVALTVTGVESGTFEFDRCDLWVTESPFLGEAQQGSVPDPGTVDSDYPQVLNDQGQWQRPEMPIFVETASKTIGLGDLFTTIVASTATNIGYTLPNTGTFANSGSAFAIYRGGAGTVTINDGGANNTLRAPDNQTGARTVLRHGTIMMMKIGSGSWIVMGRHDT